MNFRVKRRNQISVTVLLPHQVALIFANRNAYPYRFILTNEVIL